MGKRLICKALFATAIFFMCFGCICDAEHADPVFDERSWKLGWSQNQDGAVYEEYVLEGESVEAWSELVTIQFFPGLQKNTSPDVYEASVKASLTSTCPSIQWESIYQTKDDRMWKWSIKGCPGQEDQSEIARLKQTSKGFHLWHYAIKQAPLQPDKEKTWVKKLKAIVVKIE